MAANEWSRRAAAARRWLALMAALLVAAHAVAAQSDIPGPAGSGAFGATVAVLPNGNIVVVDPSGPVSNVGAVYLYTPARALLSTLTGSSADDHVGSGGIQVLANGNFVVISPDWHNGAVGNAGAVTWINGASGLSGVVTSGNSLVGTLAADRVGAQGAVALSNGNYVVRSQSWHGVSAVTWGSGNIGVAGAVSASNSLVGSAGSDKLGTIVVEVGSGNFVIASQHWSQETGAVTWANGSTGVTGSVSAANSLIGLHLASNVGSGILVLSNGNYVVLSPNWSEISGPSARGAATWANGNTGLTGTVTAANSLTGTSTNDGVGSLGVALRNGNYVIGSPGWDNGATLNAGAATWANGSTGLSGVSVSAANSLVGTSSGDGVGQSLTALANGHYVVVSSAWSNGSVMHVGAITWGSGTVGISGPLSPVNSLIGTTASDQVGSLGVVALANGNYVVRSPYWDNGAIVDAGAATWVAGGSGSSGTVSSANSLVGSSSSDYISNGGVTALSNGNYVVSSPQWRNGGYTYAGAATWGNGNAGVTGAISAANSLIGTLPSNFVSVGGIVPLSNGNYVVNSYGWDSALAPNLGAVTWGNGSRGVVGAISSANSLLGSTGDDGVATAITALNDGNYVMLTLAWDRGGIADSGAVSLGNGRFGLKGTIASWNSVLGNAASQGSTLTYAYDASRQRLVVGRPAENIVTLFTMDQVFAGGFE